MLSANVISELSAWTGVRDSVYATKIATTSYLYSNIMQPTSLRALAESRAVSQLSFNLETCHFFRFSRYSLPPHYDVKVTLITHDVNIPFLLFFLCSVMQHLRSIPCEIFHPFGQRESIFRRNSQWDRKNCSHCDNIACRARHEHNDSDIFLVIVNPFQLVDFQ